MTPSDWIAIVAIVVGGAVTIGGAWLAHLDRSGDRQEARHLAREIRLQERREPIYRDMLVMVAELEESVRSTLPFMGPVDAEAEPAPAQKAWRVMTTTVSLHGDPKVANLLAAVADAARDFFLEANYFPVDDPGEGRRDVDVKRAAFYAAVGALKQAAREDLAR